MKWTIITHKKDGCSVASKWDNIMDFIHGYRDEDIDFSHIAFFEIPKIMMEELTSIGFVADRVPLLVEV